MTELSGVTINITLKEWEELYNAKRQVDELLIELEALKRQRDELKDMLNQMIQKLI